MRWIKTVSGKQAHAVPHGSDRTMCNIPVSKACEIVSLLTTSLDRCGNCDEAWREIGAKNRPPRRWINPRLFYFPRFKFEDWEALQ